VRVCVCGALCTYVCVWNIVYVRVCERAVVCRAKPLYMW